MAVQRYQLIDALRLAAARGLERDEILNDRGLSASAVRLGFVREGLYTDTLESTADCARSFADPPSDDLLLESFAYYLEFDAFLPKPGYRPPGTH
jgi:hypothetical protein